MWIAQTDPSFLFVLWIGFLVFLFASLLFQKYRTQHLILYQKYLGYFLQPYNKLQPEIVNHEEKISSYFQKLFQILIQKKQLGSPNHRILLYLCWKLGECYRIYQPLLRLKTKYQSEAPPEPKIEKTSEEKENSSSQEKTEEPEPFEKALAPIQDFLEHLEHCLFLLEKDFEQQNPKGNRRGLFSLEIKEHPPHNPLGEGLHTFLQKEKFSRNTQESLLKLEEKHKAIRPLWSLDLLVVEWLALEPKAKEKVQEMSLQCFHCALRDEETLKQASCIHPFSVETLQKNKSDLFLELTESTEGQEHSKV